MLWKKGSDCKTLAKEMNEEGPIREQVFEERILLQNHKNFMSKEGFDEKEIQQALKDEKARQGTLMLKSVCRMQHYNEELYTLPKMLDRWKAYIHMRKLYRYWLGFANKRGEFIKSDLHYSFDKWKNYYPKQYLELRKNSKRTLDKRMLRNNRTLDLLADEVQDKENILGHLNV